MLTDVDGVRVGHWTDPVAATGCSVVVVPEGTVASGEVRGGAPATREFELLDPRRTVDRVDALVLSGGSVFGLSACDGVCRGLQQRGRGFPTGAGPVPIVVGMSLFDLMEGEGQGYPGPDDGKAALDDAFASTSPAPALTGTGLSAAFLGRTGAGAGATVGKWRGLEHTRRGGLGSATARHGDVVVAAMIAVNAFGDIDLGPGPDGSGPVALEDLPLDLVAGAFGAAADGPEAPSTRENTTIGIVVTNAALTKVDCQVVAEAAHDGYARSLFPAHSRVDGDAVAVAATGGLDRPVDLDLMRVLTVRAVESAIRSVAL